MATKQEPKTSSSELLSSEPTNTETTNEEPQNPSSEPPSSDSRNTAATKQESQTSSLESTASSNTTATNQEPQAPTSESAYHDLRRLIPSLASELDSLRTALREHNRWIQRYGHMPSQPASSLNPPRPSSSNPQAVSSRTTPSSSSTPAPPQNSDAPPPFASSSTTTELPAYSAPDVPPYEPGPESTTSDVIARRDQITEWLREGEDVLREYSARFAQVGSELGMPFDDVLGTWIEGRGDPDNALPDYEVVERREELMVGGVGEVPPPYVSGGKEVEPSR